MKRMNADARKSTTVRRKTRDVDAAMKRLHIPSWLSRVLDRSARHRYYPLVAAFVAFISTLTFSFPFAIVLIPAVLVAPRRWLILGLLCGLASGLGAAVLVELFHHYGWALVISRYPDLVTTDAWRLAVDWMQNYGLVALLVIAGSPIPQTPALFFYSLASPSAFGVLVAVGIGKIVKYVFLAWATYRYPSRFMAYR